MRKILFAALALLLGAGIAGAQNAVLDKIEKANQGQINVECVFSRTRTLPATGKVIKDGGTLWYTSPEKLNMAYDNPKEALVINGNMMFVKRAGKPSTFDTSKNSLMKGLRDVLLDCIGGRVDKVARDNGAKVNVKEVKDFYNITLETDASGAKGYTRIALTYRRSDCLLVRMETVEVGGVSEVIKMEEITKVASVDAAKYEIPRK